MGGRNSKGEKNGVSLCKKKVLTIWDMTLAKWGRKYLYAAILVSLGPWVLKLNQHCEG